MPSRRLPVYNPDFVTKLSTTTRLASSFFVHFPVLLLPAPKSDPFNLRPVKKSQGEREFSRIDASDFFTGRGKEKWLEGITVEVEF